MTDTPTPSDPVKAAVEKLCHYCGCKNDEHLFSCVRPPPELETFKERVTNG